MESYSEECIKLTYQNLGIKPDDIVYVTSSLAMMGRPPTFVKKSTQLCELFYRPLLEVLGPNGTVIAPAFSYTFGKGNAAEPAIFDPENTCADIGLFPNFLLNQAGVKRTLDPMLSMAYIGGEIPSLTENLDSATYTDNSFLARLANSKAKFLNIGIGAGWLPFVHYIDWLLESPYRYNKIFHGYIKEGEQRTKKSWMYSVRTLIENSLPDTEEIGRRALQEGIWKKAKLGSREVYCCDCKEYFEFALRQIKQEPWLVAKGPVVDTLKAEKQRTGEELHLVNYTDFNSMSWISYFNSLRRDLVSDSMDALFTLIKQYFPLSITRVTTGKIVFGRVVPERWLIKGASIKDSQGSEILNENDEGKDVYSYSLPISSKVSRQTLLKHIHFYDQAEGAKAVYNDRDWGFLCPRSTLDKFNDEEYFVEIDSYSSLGEMLYGSLSFQTATSQQILICCYTEGPDKVYENLSGVVTCLQLYRVLNTLESKANIRFLFLPNFTSFLCWFENNKDISSDIESVYHLKFVGTDKEILMQQFQIVNEEVSLFFESSKPFTPFEDVHLPFDNFILGSEMLGGYSMDTTEQRRENVSERGLQKIQEYLLDIVL